MAKATKPLVGYIKTSNVYLIVLLTLSVGFLGGVLFSAYRTTSIAPVSSGGMPPSGSSPAVQLSQDQSQKLNALLQATQSTPDNVEAWTQLGHFYFDAGKVNDAIAAYEKSLSLNDARPDVWTDLGVMYRRSKNPKKAIEAFDRALTLNDKHEAATFNKGVVFMHDLNDVKSALVSWEKLVAINPNAKAPNGQLVSTMLAQMKKQAPKP